MWDMNALHVVPCVLFSSSATCTQPYALNCKHVVCTMSCCLHQTWFAQVAHETEVKAQIKLRFITSSGQPVVVVRSFQLSQKKAALQFKTLDSILQTINAETGEKQAVTYRCVDIDKMVPSLMGVSKVRGAACVVKATQP